MASRAIVALIFFLATTSVIVGHLSASLNTEPIVDRWHEYTHNDEYSVIVIDEYPAAVFKRPIYHAHQCVAWRASVLIVTEN